MCKSRTTTSSSPSLLNNSNHCTNFGKRRRFGKGSLQMTITKSSSPSEKLQQHSSTCTGSVSEETSLFTTYDLYTLRKRLQKIEFFMCWVIVFIMAGTNISPTFPVVCLKLSAFTRFFAYVLDFSNAYVKLDGSIPLWLVLHHSGVLFGHITNMFFLTPSSQFEVIMFALASQSSHNTWTKKLSLVLYWGNVLFGVLTCSYLHFSHDESNAASCFYWSLLVTSFGIALLVRDTLSKSKKVA
jgi:hypothetical protein